MCTNLSTIRECVGVGVCAQVSLLFDSLSCREHLNIYARVRGLSRTARTEEIPRLLRLLQLESKADTRTHALSGGMKRKLSVAIALVGGPRVVFLTSQALVSTHLAAAIYGPCCSDCAATVRLF